MSITMPITISVAPKPAKTWLVNHLRDARATVSITVMSVVAFCHHLMMHTDRLYCTVMRTALLVS